MTNPPDVRRSDVIVPAARTRISLSSARKATNEKAAELLKPGERLGHVKLDGPGKPAPRDQVRWEFTYEVWTS